MMSRPDALSFFAFSATSMIALGFARLMRSASIGIGSPRGGLRKGQNSITRPPLRSASTGPLFAGREGAGSLRDFRPRAGKFATLAAGPGSSRVWGVHSISALDGGNRVPSALVHHYWFHRRPDSPRHNAGS